MISAIVPARNEEENISRVVESLAAQPEIFEIIVVNDQSTDRTGAILAELAAKSPRIKVIETRELPAGWTGKNHALHLGAQAAREPWLLFTDADTVHLPNAAAVALALAREFAAALVSFSPEQETRTLGERLLVPFVLCRLAQRFSYERVTQPGSLDAAANGQYMLIRRDAYEAVGGHAAVRSSVLEDVALAELVKGAHYRLFFGPGHGIVRARMYRTFRAMWEGWTKNLYLLAGGTFRGTLSELGIAMPWVALFLAALVSFFAWGAIHPGAYRAPVLAGLVVLAVQHVLYGVELKRNHFPVSYIQYYLPGAFLYGAALVVSAWKHQFGSVVWKGREYPAGMP